MKYLVKNKESGEICCHRARLASGFLDRLKGLMFTDSLGSDDGLILRPCNSIHTFFMNYSIDVIMISKTNKVIKVIHAMRPWRMTRTYFRAYKVLEMSEGKANRKIKEGDHLEILCIN